MAKYGKGTIVNHKGTFPDGTPDVTGHPVLLTLAVDELTGETYFLTITSQDRHYNAYPDEYYPLDDCWEELGLKKPSYINLKNLRQDKIDGAPITGLPPQLFKNVVRCFKDFQEKQSIPCKYYEEVKKLLKL